MLKTRMTELLGIKYPIMQGGMQHLGVADFASVVSNAGGLGTINITCFSSPQEFEAELQKMNKLTKKPYAVNFSFLPEMSVQDQQKFFEYVDICIGNGVNVVETAGGDPSPYIPTLHEHGIKVIHKAPNLKVAKSMERKGVDLVTIIGFEVAGHPSMDGIGTMVMSNLVASNLSIPVLSAGGIVDGKGLAAALCLGCEGVVMGTRFVATNECIISQAHKDWIVNHCEKDTRLIMNTIHNTVRAADNEAARKCLEMESRGATLQELMTVISGKKGREAYETGNVDGGVFCVGPGIGLINNILPVKDLIENMVSEAELVIDRIQSLRG